MCFDYFIADKAA